MTYQRIDFYRRVDVAHVVPVPSPPPYEGPGNIVASAAAWWGLRAYSLATVGDNAVRLRRDSDNAEQTFVTIAGGGLDLAAISSFKGAANLFVTTLFDQTGNGSPLTQTAAGSQPTFILAALGAFPVIRAGDYMECATVFGSQPFTHSLVAKRNSGTGPVIGTSGGQVRSGFGLSANLVRMIAGGTEMTAAATDGSFYAIQCVYNGASSDLNLNGSANTGNPGSNAHVSILRYNSDFSLNPDLVEAGIWPAAFSSGQSSSMSSNQHDYWGF
jgi:hypothetical protein